MTDIDSTKAILKSRLQLVQENLARRDEEIKEATDRLRSLFKDRERLSRERVNLAEALAPYGEAPICRVPFDILARIMEFCVAGQGSRSWWENIAQGTCMSTILSQVNQQFRQVAVDTASLWTSIRIQNNPLTPRNELFLSRSKGSLLDIRIIEMRTPMHRTDWVSLLESLPPPSRWRSFSIDNRNEGLSFRDLQDILPQCCRSQAPNLETLELVGFTHTRHGVPLLEVLPEMEELFGGVIPRLSALTLYDMPFLWIPSLFSSLVSLDITIRPHEQYTVIAKYLQLFPHMTRLRNLIIMGTAGTTSVHPSSEALQSLAIKPVELTGLQELHIGGMQTATIASFLSSLHVPNVEFLILDNWVLNVYYDEPLGLITNDRFPALRRLKLESVIIFDIIKFGCQLPAVTELEICSRERLMKHYGRIMAEYYWTNGEDGIRRGTRRQDFEDLDIVAGIAPASALSDNEPPTVCQGWPFQGLLCLKFVGWEHLEDVAPFLQKRLQTCVGPRKVMFNAQTRRHQDMILKKLGNLVEVEFFESKQNRFRPAQTAWSARYSAIDSDEDMSH